MLKLWKKKISIKLFSMSHERPTVFLMSQWQQRQEPNVYYLIFRWLLALTFLISWIFSIMEINKGCVTASYRIKWLIYITNWGYSICTFQALLSAIMLSSWLITTRRRGFTHEEDKKATKLYKIYWTANIIATDIAFGITVIYWTIIYDDQRMQIDAMNVVVHGSNSLLMMLELCVVAHPVRILHGYWPVLFGICYNIFGVIYYLLGGTGRDGNRYVYKILDWGQPCRTVFVCLGVFLFLFLIHCFTYFLYQVRTLLHARLLCKGQEKLRIGESIEAEGYVNRSVSEIV